MLEFRWGRIGFKCDLTPAIRRKKYQPSAVVNVTRSTTVSVLVKAYGSVSEAVKRSGWYHPREVGVCIADTEPVWTDQDHMPCRATEVLNKGELSQATTCLSVTDTEYGLDLLHSVVFDKIYYLHPKEKEDIEALEAIRIAHLGMFIGVESYSKTIVMQAGSLERAGWLYCGQSVTLHLSRHRLEDYSCSMSLC